jgi:ABC-type dipeptide/oligopeptide/nickel transport system permease component
MKTHEYIARRLLFAVPKLFLTSIVIFLVIHLAPGDPIQLRAPRGATEAQIQQLRVKYGLDEPLHIQYLLWLENVLQGDLGMSIHNGRPVSGMLLERLPISFKFSLLGLVLIYLIGIPVGIVSAIYQDTWVDYVSMGFVLVAVSFPSFWFGIILIMIFGVQLGWTEVVGYGTLGLLLLPAFALGVRGSALEARVTRSSMLETLREDYIDNLRANGVSERRLIFKHAFKNALSPVITLLGLRIGWAIAAGMVLEIVFVRPGIGKLMIESIFRRDYPVVQSILLMIATMIILGNLIADVLYSVVDPRIKYE